MWRPISVFTLGRRFIRKWVWPIQLLDQTTGPGLGRFALLPVRRVQVLQIAGDVLGDLLDPPLHLVGGEVAVAGVHRLELRAIDRDQGGAEQAQLAAQNHELGARRLDRRTVSHISSTLRCASRSRRRLDCTLFR